MADIFAVLADRTRRDLLDALRAGEAPVGRLAVQIGLAQPAVSKHLRVLRIAGLVDVRSAAQRRYYRVRPEALAEAARWLEPYRAMWADRLGRLATAGAGWSLHFERPLRHPATRVWQALTEPEQLAGWFPTLIQGAWASGAPLEFRFAAGQGPDFAGEVLAAEPPHLLEFRWGPDRLRFELRPGPGDGCTLLFTVTFDELGRAAAGWHVCLDALAARLGTAVDEPDAAAPSSWASRNAEYVQRFGPEAATVGPPRGA